MRGDLPRLRVLAAEGPVRYNKEDEYGHTPLHEAVVGGQAAAVALLLEAGAAVDAAGCGATPLHRAAALGHVTIVAQLLAAGASVAAIDRSTPDARTPLAKAAAAGHAACVAALLAAGAPLEAIDARGATPWQLAAHGGHTGVAAALAAAGAVTTAPLPVAADAPLPLLLPEVASAAPADLPPPPLAPLAPSATCAACRAPAYTVQFVAVRALPPAAAARLPLDCDASGTVPLCMRCCRTYRCGPP